MKNVDRWIITKISDKGKIFYKLFASFIGGYLDGDAWRVNSGIKTIIEHETYYEIFGYSGSCYICKKQTYGTINYTKGVLERLIKKSKGRVELIETEKEFLLELNKYIIK